MGKVNPYKVKEMVECETKKKVQLIFPSAEMEGDRDENKGNEAKLLKQIKTVHKNDVANKKTEERLTVLKIKLCCNSCNQKLRKNLKIKGLDIVSMDVDKHLLKVKGTTDLTDLRSYMKKELKKDVEIVIPPEVMVHVKKGNGTAKKKEKLAGNIYKKDKDAGATNKKDKGTAFSEKNQDTGKANEKIEGIAGVDEKNKASAAVKEPDKDKNDGLRNNKDRNNDEEMKSKMFNTMGGERNGDGGGNKEEGELKNKAVDSTGSETGVGNREEYGSSTIKCNPGPKFMQGRESGRGNHMETLGGKLERIVGSQQTKGIETESRQQAMKTEIVQCAHKRDTTAEQQRQRIICTYMTDEVATQDWPSINERREIDIDLEGGKKGGESILKEK
ncbi:heavy metal-associated isoprenylated plant protein 5-like isoform X2 [Mangifera indica]|nr:heavy metal-associated isoprenylated plant protein 5-like isoform X2 [Mangifera indica]